jgi:hypothetical protein
MAAHLWGSDNGNADWGPLNDIDFDSVEAIHRLGETGRVVAIHSADVVAQSLADFYAALLATPALGGSSPEAKRRAKRLLRPLGWTSSHALPAAARRFSQLPARFRSIYEEQLSPAAGSRKGIDISTGRR